MIDLYTVPLGATARDFFSAEAENKYSYDEALLVLPSRNCLWVICCTSWLNCRAWTILVNWQIKKVSLKLLPGF